MSEIRRHVDAVLATGISLSRLPALLDELEADAFRRGFDAGIEHATGFTPEHQHRVVRRPDGSDGACCDPGTVTNPPADVDWLLPPEPLQVDTPVFDEPPTPGLERFLARLRRNLRGES